MNASARLSISLALLSAIGGASCGGGDASDGGGGSSAHATSSAASSSGASSSSGTSSKSAAQSSSSGAPMPGLSVPGLLDLPYVVAGAGGSSAKLVLANGGDAELTGPNGGAIAIAVSGDASITAGAAPKSIAAKDQASVDVTFAGASAETIATATIAITTALGEVDVEVFAVAGDPNLGSGSWEQVLMPGGVIAGEGVTLAMPTAPFPDGSASYMDPSVHVFLPDGYRDRGAQDLVIHFHGFDTTIADTLATHLYREQVYASGANDVLVVPQGPVNASDGDFGKLMKEGGLAALANEVLVVLYREGKITRPVLGELALTSHSGGYQAVAFNIDPSNNGPDIRQVDLFDSLYGDMSTYEDYATSSGHFFRSDYTENGGTLANNEQAASDLANDGLDVAADDEQVHLRAAGPVVFFANTDHDDSTRIDACYADELRFASHHSRSGPRVELREAIASGGMATVKWLSPADDDLEGFSIQTSIDGVTWKVVASAKPSDMSATFAMSGGARVRVVPTMPGISQPLASDVYRVDDGASVLVVDGFDRVLDGAWGGLSHDFAAIVGEAAGKVATISHRAITEDAFDLSPYATIVWCLGDQSVLDHSLTSAEQAAITSYLDGGGHLVVSGSELGYDLAMTSSGASFLASTFGLDYAEDASGSYTAIGAGALSSVATFSYAGASAPYHVDYPDVYSLDGGEEILDYGNGKIAGVGVAHRAAAIGFPLELVDDDAARSNLVKALVAFVGP